ncbi:MAG: glycerol-3-phosphate 1-O-acyltransferase PlsY [Pseudomonadota bacterium]
MYVSDCIQIMILGYALGSVPFGVLLAKLFGLPDPRYIGSGNIGATNMLRTGNKKVALLTLLLDAGKGAAAVILAVYLFTPEDSIIDGLPCMDWDCSTTAAHAKNALAVLLAAIGHMYSPWLKFKGGKGVATLLGGALAFAWPVGMGAIVIWILVCYTTRYVSLASIAALTVAPLIAWLRVDGTSAIILAIACAVAIWKHRSNIKRLRDGFEPRISFARSNP